MSRWMWIPDVSVKALGLRGALGHQEQRLTISMNGDITWHRRFVDKFETRLDFERMPFDNQTLTIDVGTFATGAEPVTSLRWRTATDEAYSMRTSETQMPTSWIVCGSITKDGKTRTGLECGAGLGEDRNGNTLSAHLLIERNYDSYFYDYIYPSCMLMFLSYAALFIDKQNPGRPGIHSVTVLTEITLKSALSDLLPPVNDTNGCWIVSLQNTLLVCHFLLFLEFGVVHYAERHKLRQKLKEREEAKLLLELDEQASRPDRPAQGGAAAEPAAAEGASRPASPVRSAAGVGGGGEGGEAARRVHSSESTGSTLSRPVADARSDSGEPLLLHVEPSIGLPSLAEMLQEDAEGSAGSGCRCCTRLRSVLGRGMVAGQTSQSLPTGSTRMIDFASQDLAVRADSRTWHRWAGVIDWFARFSFPPIIGVYFFVKLEEVGATLIALGMEGTAQVAMRVGVLLSVLLVISLCPVRAPSPDR